MEHISFQVKGSANEPYEVQFTRQPNGSITATCSCPAGLHGRLCKHRLSVLNGDTSNIFKTTQAELDRLASWVNASTLKNEIENIVLLEAQAEAIRKSLKSAKKSIEKKLRG